MKSPAASANLSDLPVLKVLARARAEGRMPHAVLLTGADGTVLARAAEQLAALHLGEADPLSHSDCRVLRPAKKSRRITIDNTLEVVAALRLSSLSPHRVVIVNEPDRFQPDSANAFLKTLEEPPPGTLIILQTTNYYRVLPTILSRCLRFHVAGDAPVLADPSWSDWLREMEKLLLIYCKRRSVKYTQGLNELLAPFVDLRARLRAGPRRLPPQFRAQRRARRRYRCLQRGPPCGRSVGRHRRRRR